MKRQRQQHIPSSSSWLLLAAAAFTIPTLLHAFAPPIAQNKRSVQVQHHHRQPQQPSSLISTPSLSFLARTPDTTSRSKLFARGPGRPSAASLEEEDDDDLDFEDEADDEEVEGKL